MLSSHYGSSAQVGPQDSFIVDDIGWNYFKLQYKVLQLIICLYWNQQTPLWLTTAIE